MKKRSFTFVEIMLVAVIFSVLIVSVYGTLSAGLKLWKRTQKVDFLERKILNVIEKFSSQLRQCLSISEIEFQGKTQEIIFSTLTSKGIIIVCYSFDFETKTLIYKQKTYREFLEDKSWHIKKRVSGIEDFSLSYFFYDQQKGKYLWVQEWQDKEKIPLGVKISLRYDSKFKTFKIFIPTA